MYLSVLISVILLITFCQGVTFAKDSDIVAKIGDQKITVSDFNRILGYMDPERQKLAEKNPQLREALLKQIVQSIVISEIAKKKGFDKTADFKEQMKLFSDNFLANEYLKKEVATKVTVSEETMKSYYESHKDEFKAPEMVKARHILIKADQSVSDEDKKNAKAKAENILNKIKSGEDFAKLASEHSDDPGSKQKGGELGFFPRGRMVKPFEDAAFALKAGEISRIVETQFGYHIIKVEERKDEAIEPYNDVKERLSQKLTQEQTKTRVTEFIDKAMKDAKADMHPELLTGEKK
jgi:peptidyl-prolyl cis-trans isomerase C